MKALRFDGRLKFVSDAPSPARPGEALVRVLCAGICNTDLEITKGYGGFRGVLGHEFVGRVEDAPGDDLHGSRVVGNINVGCGHCGVCRAGDPRHCRDRTVLGIRGRDGAFAEYLSLPLANLHSVPDAIPDETAVFAEPLAAACRVLEQVAISERSRVAIIGDGKLAQLIARVLSGTGCSLTMFGRHEEKLELARGLSIDVVTVDDRFKREPARGVRPGERESYDVVVEASGSPSGPELALALVRSMGTVVLKSTHGGKVSLDASGAVVREVKLVGSRCGRVSDAIGLMNENRLDFSALISDWFPLDEGVLAFERAAEPACLKTLLRVSQS